MNYLFKVEYSEVKCHFASGGNPKADLLFFLLTGSSIQWWKNKSKYFIRHVLTSKVTGFVF